MLFPTGFLIQITHPPLSAVPSYTHSPNTRSRCSSQLSFFLLSCFFSFNFLSFFNLTSYSHSHARSSLVSSSLSINTKKVMQGGCPVPPTKPKGRPKKNSIPSLGILDSMMLLATAAAGVASSSLAGGDGEGKTPHNCAAQSSSTPSSSSSLLSSSLPGVAVTASPSETNVPMLHERRIQMHHQHHQHEGQTLTSG